MILHQYCDGLKPLYLECVDQLRSKIPDNIGYKSWGKNPYIEYDHITDKRLRSDSIRVELLCQEGDNAYLDADTMCISFPNINEWEKDKPWMTKHSNGNFTCAVIFSFGCNKFFKEIKDRYSTLSNKSPLWLQTMINKYYKNDIYTIPNNHFVELALNMDKGSFYACGTNQFSLKQKNGVTYIDYVKGIKKNGNYV